jgi:hypothetical protein
MASPLLHATTLGLLMLIAGPVQSDALLRFVDSQGETSQLLVKGPYARMDLTNGGSGRTGFMLFNATDRSLYVVDETSGTYMAFDESVVDAQTRAMAQMIEQMQEEIRQLPAEVRAELEAQLGLGVESVPIEVETRATGRQRTIGDIRCQETEILVAGRVQSIACVAGASDLGLARIDFNTVTELMGRLYDLSRRALDAGGPMARAMGPNVLPRLDGVPLEVRDLQDDVTTQLVGVSTDTLSPEFFRVPPSYREQPPFQP